MDIPYNCNAQWLIRYVPAKGITGAWFIQRQDSTAYLMPRWDDISGRGMVVEINDINPPEGGVMPFWWLDEGEPQLLSTPDGYLPAGVSYLLAPHATSVMVYQMDYPDTNRTAISLIETEGFTERALYTPPFPAYYGVDFAFSADGSHLYMAWQVPGGINNNAGEGTVVQAVEVDTGKVQEWWSAEEGTIYFLAPDAQAPFVYAMTFAPQASQGIRLVKLTPDGSNLLTNGGEAFGISLVRRCASGGLLYLRLDTPTEQETRYELDPRYLHIVSVDASGTEQNRVFPLSAAQVPVLCP